MALNQLKGYHNAIKILRIIVGMKIIPIIFNAFQ